MDLESINKQLYKSLNVLYKNYRDNRFCSQQPCKHTGLQHRISSHGYTAAIFLQSHLQTNREARSLSGEADNSNKADNLTKSDNSVVQWVGRAAANKEKGKVILREHCFEGIQMSTLLQNLRVGSFAF